MVLHVNMNLYGNARRWCFLLVAFFSLAMFSLPTSALDIVVKGLFKNGAVLDIDGQQRMLKVGKVSPEGILLIEADSKKAVIELNGAKRTLFLSGQIGAHYSKPEVAEVRIAASRGDHHYASGMINNQRVSFLVDTGATAVSMSADHAKRLGLDYKSGKPGRASTASGVADTYSITLRQVSVGGISLSNVRASVVVGSYPKEILLGNTFLSRVNFKVESGVLVLQKKY